jgi:hypothetical protein
MAGPGDEIAGRAGGHGHLRASHGELLLGTFIRRALRDDRAGGQPPQRSINTGPAAGHRAASAAPAEQLPHTTKPSRPRRAEAARGHFPRPQVCS